MRTYYSARDSESLAMQMKLQADGPQDRSDHRCCSAIEQIYTKSDTLKILKMSERRKKQRKKEGGRGRLDALPKRQKQIRISSSCPSEAHDDCQKKTSH